MVLTIISLVWLHFGADFLLQNDWMALNKSRDSRILTVHVLVYALPFVILFGWRYGLVNFGLHWITDFLSSRATSALYRRKENHWFFAVVGLDQAIHLTSLIVTMPLITGAIWS